MGNNSCIDCSRRNKLKEINNEIFEGILEQECLLWDIFQNRFRRTKFFVTKPKNNKISYISDNGSIMRIEQIRDQQLQQSEILTNIEQIKFLKWIGQYGNNQQKIGRWKAFWQGESLIGIGGIYSEDGQKQGQWNLLFQNYTKEFQVCESGEYLNDQKIKLWKYTLGNEEIGGGLYDNQGKQGQWIELANNFQVHSQITLIGEYKNGKKVGRWDTYHRMKNQQQFQLIGGGTYDIQEGSNSFKIGIWKEPSEGFHSRNKVMYEGQYKNGIKVGRWEIQMIQDTGMMMKIGGGEYDDKQEANNHLSMKQGKWLELNDLLQISSQVIYQGEYKNGLKIGRWEIYWKDDDDGSFNLIAGGLYKPKLDDQFSGDIKQGRWVELSEGFRNSSQITWKGVYQNNNKVGRWDISFQWENYGGGSYNEVDAELIVKVGKWFELSDQFSKKHLVVHKGAYKNGKKVGRWNAFWSSQMIGAGCYDEQGNGIKIGKWIDLDDRYFCQKTVIYKGEYKNGNKIGRWNAFWISGFEIGGGCYNKQGDGIKIGKWIDLDDRFYSLKQVTYHGEYKNGNKVGRWNTFWNSRMYVNTWCCYDGREITHGASKKIGGGCYDDQGDGIKIRKWIDLDDEFDKLKSIIYSGEYKNGKKVGIWEILYFDDYKKNPQLFGGGSYDENGNGFKIGKWIDWIEFGKNYEGFITYHGNYKNGKKVGTWNVFNEFGLVDIIQYQN